MFACCHPALSVEYQIILSLKILCGFSIKEIAVSLLKKETAVAKAYTRAKHKFVQENIKLEIPENHQVTLRLKIVLKVIYLLFNEGYKTSSGKELFKIDLCYEAIRLNQLIIKHKHCNSPNVHALLALMLLHISRFESRVGIDGELVTLENQDRTLWDKEAISVGMYHLNLSLEVGHHSEFHIQAAISALHCKAASFEETNWEEMLILYDAMIKINPSPVTKLNRLIPLSKVKGVDLANENLMEIEGSGFFNNYYLYYVIKGQFEAELGNIESSIKSFKKASGLTENIKEKQFLEQKMSALN
jgi:RNA polymerase sigma-70 factor (ECF subfamily)